jgi:murein DD-endopeptidase MepM/ murein hydrolase activator NlpD
MAGDKYTILFVSEKEEKTRRFRLSKSGLRFLVLVVFVSVVGGITALIYSAGQLKQITDLNADNEKMRSERKEVVEMIRDLQRIQEMDIYVRQSMGVPATKEPVASGGEEFPQTIPVSYLENVPSHVPVYGFVSQLFSEGTSSTHQGHTGLDVAAPVRTAVHSTADGLVVFSGWHYPYGNLIIISHGNGYFSLYGHNVQNLVKEKQRVKRGELIALVGETGVTSGPHLHFEIWKDGKVVDPAFFIAEYRSDYMTLKMMKRNNQKHVETMIGEDCCHHW